MFARAASRLASRPRPMQQFAVRTVRTKPTKWPRQPVSNFWLIGGFFVTLYAVDYVTGKMVEASECEGLPVFGTAGTNQERTFLAIKPDGVQRGLIGDIISRFEKRGYKLVGLKMVWPTKEMAEEHYADLSKKPFFPGLVEFFSSGPIVCM